MIRKQFALIPMLTDMTGKQLKLRFLHPVLSLDPPITVISLLSIYISLLISRLVSYPTQLSRRIHAQRSEIEKMGQE